MVKFGIDVSKWQGADFDFERAITEDKVQFAVLRGAYSCPIVKSNGGKDSQFENYYKKCKALNLPVGVYQYSMATTVAQARQEADFLYNNVLKGKQFELPIYIDIEDKVQLDLPRQTLTDIAKAWCEYLEPKKYFVGIYAGKYTFRDQMDDAQLKRYTHWVPMWGAACTYEDKSVLGMWQFGGETNCIRSSEIAGKTVDQNFMYVDFPTIIKNEKLNGFGATASAGATVTANKAPTFSKGDKVTLTSGATYYNGKAIPSWVKKCKLYVRSEELAGGDYNVSILKIGAITGRVNKKYLKKA